MFKKMSMGTFIAGLGTICSIIGMVLDKHSQQKIMKETIVEEVAKAISNK